MRHGRCSDRTSLAGATRPAYRVPTGSVPRPAGSQPVEFTPIKRHVRDISVEHGQLGVSRDQRGGQLGRPLERLTQCARHPTTKRAVRTCTSDPDVTAPSGSTTSALQPPPGAKRAARATGAGRRSLRPSRLRSSPATCRSSRCHRRRCPRRDATATDRRPGTPRSRHRRLLAVASGRRAGRADRRHRLGPRTGSSTAPPTFAATDHPDHGRPRDRPGRRRQRRRAAAIAPGATSASSGRLVRPGRRPDRSTPPARQRRSAAAKRSATPTPTPVGPRPSTTAPSDPAESTSAVSSTASYGDHERRPIRRRAPARRPVPARRRVPTRAARPRPAAPPPTSTGP